jgi:hypothetical protein
MKRHVLGAIALAAMAWAQDSSQTPKKETLAEAIQFEKHKVDAGEAQARKDAAESRGTARKSASSSAAARKSQKDGQADKAKK